VIIFSHLDMLWPSIRLIFSDAFSGNAVMGGAVGQLIITGIKRGTFSNEAGLGTAPMAHGAAKTNEPVREGLVAMLGPIIDTVLICTMTALAIIVTGAWKHTNADGITLTAEAFMLGMPGYGQYVLLLCITIFSMTTIFAFPYYGAKCYGFLFGARKQSRYNYFYLFSILLGATASLTIVVNIVDGVYAFMAVPNMIAALLLAPKVKRAAVDYFKRLKTEGRAP
jgi:AGCS family alanine or glycine:cation symporter